MKFRIAALAAATLAIVGAAPIEAQAPVAAPLDEAAQRAVIARAAGELRNRYIFPDIGEKAAARLEEQLAAGAYSSLTDRRAFAEKLTADIYDVARDKHMRVSTPGMHGPTTPASQLPRSDSDVVRADRLAGDIGYVQVIGFTTTLDRFVPAIERAMAPLADSKAIILDLRLNNGGSASLGVYLSSFFTDPSKTVALNSLVRRTPGTREFTTQPYKAVKTNTSLFGKPLYVLVSSRTLSAGEAVAFDLQALKLGTLVGETTWGGANPRGPTLPLGSQITMEVPSARAENPATGANWEGVGVVPDIPAPPADALKVALERLGQKPLSGDIDALSHARLFTPRTIRQPGTEAAVRRLVKEIATGQLAYTLLSPGLQQSMPAGLATLTKILADLGDLKDVKFREVGHTGLDIYDVEFAKGAQVWRILQDEQGRTISLSMAPASSVDKP